MHWYYSLLARRPYFVILSLVVFSFACITVSLCLKKLPNFSDPALGFEARGTEISRRLTAWKNLENATGPGGKLSVNPNEMNNFGDLELGPSQKRRNRKQNRGRDKNKGRKSKSLFQQLLPNTSKNVDNLTKEDWSTGVFREFEKLEETFNLKGNLSNSEEIISYGRNTVYVDEDLHRKKIERKKNTWLRLKETTIPKKSDDEFISENFFCSPISKDYVHFVVKRVGPNMTDSLLELNSLLALCEMQEQITSIKNYDNYCETDTSGTCCKPWSLVNYLVLHFNKTSCFDFTIQDVTSFENLLLTCYEYYKDMKLTEDCYEFNTCSAPIECTQNDLVFNVLHFLTDFNFMKNNESIFLKYSMIFVPIIQSSKILPLFYEWEEKKLSNELIRVEAMDLGLENEIFNEMLLNDCCLVILGGLLVLCAMWLYTSSIFVTFMTSIAVLFALGLAYFIYVLVFEFSFFPYMNIIAIVVTVGIGADDAFIFVKIWETVLHERYSKDIGNTAQIFQKFDNENSESLQSLLAMTLKHSAVSMLVTSLTTAGAFFASYSSHITAIKCFGIFAGTTVITNYLFMITWLPASVSIKERFSSYNKFIIELKIQRILFSFKKSIRKFCQSFEAAIVKLVINYSWLWLIIFGLIGMLSVGAVLYWPGIKLPTKTHFQLLSSSHPFEKYNTKFKNEFWFEKTQMDNEYMKMPLRFVWGILPIDDGDYTDPYSTGNLHYDNNFNISMKESQTWLLNFCHELRQEPFYEETLGQLLPDCFIENFLNLMNRMCIDDMSGIDRSPCCETSKFPYEPFVFDWCLPQIISLLYATPREFFQPGTAGPKFAVSADWSFENNTYESGKLSRHNISNLQPPIVKALVISFNSNISFTTNYKEMQTFVNTVEEWFQTKLQTAPLGMRNGFFVSELKFFDVQDTLSKGTISAIGFAMCIALIVLLLVTLNVLVSFYAVVTICLSIFTTVAILICLGWTLGILESITVTTAIGLAVDFSLHFGIQYRMSPKEDRVSSATYALERIVSPTAMAALTTGFAGVFMLASNVLAYIQVGIFLSIVMSVSWLFSSFFLISLLKVAGPQYGFMQFHYPKFQKTSSPKQKYYERKPSHLVVSEQLLTPCSSAVGDLINSETHELESLNSNSNIKTVSSIELDSKLRVSKQ